MTAGDGYSARLAALRNARDVARLFDVPADLLGGAAEPVELRVRGVPQQQGSKTARPVYAGKKGSPGRRLSHINQVDANDGPLKAWRAAIEAAAIPVMRRRVMFTGPVALSAVFTMPRPRSHYRTGRNSHLLRDAARWRPSATPDLDKLVRAVMDGLTQGGVWKDDALVVEFGRVAEFYPGTDPQSFAEPGALITVEAVPR